MTVVELRAPVDGVVVPLEQVPDPVFAQKMVGDGLAIDPLGQLLVSPCHGTVSQLHRAGHAVAVTTAGGIEVLMHIGLDTVALQGKGFTPRVKEGQAVRTGDALIGFDADFLATHARSLLTLMVITGAEGMTAVRAASGRVRAGQDVCLTLEVSGETGSGPEVSTGPAPAAGRRVASETVVVPNATGLHARPAAVLANLAKRFQSKILLQRGEASANAKSIVWLMGLEVACGDRVVLVAEGSDAAEAIAKLTPELAAGLGDEGTRPAPAPVRPAPGARRPASASRCQTAANASPA